MKNFRNSGQEVTYLATQNQKSGDVVQIGNMVGICACDVLAGGQCSADIEGVFELKKAQGVSFQMGDKVYYNQATFASSSKSDAVAGLATRVAQATDATVYVKLVPGMPA